MNAFSNAVNFLRSLSLSLAKDVHIIQVQHYTGYKATILSCSHRSNKYIRLNIKSISDKIGATITKFKQSQKVSIQEKLIDGKLSIEFSAERIKLVINNTIISVNAQDEYILTRSFSGKDEIINKIRTLRYEVEKSSNNSEEKRKTHFLLQRMEYILTSTSDSGANSIFSFKA